MIFVDTGALFARYYDRDDHHRAAISVWARLATEKPRLFISSLVFAQFCTLLGRKAGNAFAIQRARRIHASDQITILRLDAEDEKKTLFLFEKYSDQGVDFTDCASFVLMRRHRIPRAFTFDRHFRLAGFDVLDR